MLPRHHNLMYIRLEDGLYFGLTCIIGSSMDQEESSIDNWMYTKDKLKRMNSVQCKDQSEFLTLSLHRLEVMVTEFPEAYASLFENQLSNLRKIIQVKLKAIQYSNKFLNCTKLERKITQKGKNMFTNCKIMNNHVEQENKCTFEPILQSEL